MLEEHLQICDIEVLYSYIPSYNRNLDWPILTERAEDQFLIEHFIDYPWDLDVLSSDFSRNIETIEQLILLQRIHRMNGTGKNWRRNCQMHLFCLILALFR